MHQIRNLNAEFLTLFSEYVKAAKKLEQIGSPAKLAKIDCTVEKALGTKYGVKGYPTLKFFKNGKPVDYAGPREAAVSRYRFQYFLSFPCFPSITTHEGEAGGL